MKNMTERQVRWLLGGLGFACFLLLITLEIVTEEDDVSIIDIAVDAIAIFLTIGAATGVALLAQRMQVQHEEKMDLLRDLDIARTEGSQWRGKVQTHLAGLKEGMDVQFRDWGLTTAESEVGLLILKGLSHKEVAALRATTEATVRQQAQSIYRKAKLPGKTAFSAYFLEDLFDADLVGKPPSLQELDSPMPGVSAKTHRETSAAARHKVCFASRIRLLSNCFQKRNSIYGAIRQTLDLPDSPLRAHCLRKRSCSRTDAGIQSNGFRALKTPNRIDQPLPIAAQAKCGTATCQTPGQSCGLPGRASSNRAEYAVPARLQ